MQSCFSIHESKEDAWKIRILIFINWSSKCVWSSMAMQM